VEVPEPGTATVGEEHPPHCRITVLGGVEVVTQRELVIGSDPRCGLVLPADADVQPLHALLTPLGGCWTLHALSGAGLGDPGQGRVKSLPVESGTRVQLGKARLLFGFAAEGGQGNGWAAVSPSNYGEGETTYAGDSNYGSEVQGEGPVAR